LLSDPQATHRTVTDIAFACGFNNSSHFGRAPKGFPVHVGGVYTDPFKHGANLAFIEIGREIEGVMTLLPQRLRDFSGGWQFAFPLFL
jgi:hypothetical protein